MASEAAPEARTNGTWSAHQPHLNWRWKSCLQRPKIMALEVRQNGLGDNALTAPGRCLRRRLDNASQGAWTASPLVP